MLIPKSLKNLLDKLLFSCILLLGIQLPNFVTQYHLSLTAHYQEANSQLMQYRKLADRFYSGDLLKLIAVHQHNEVAAIKAEAEIISNLISRKSYLQQQLQALQNSTLTGQLVHLVFDLDIDITKEVLNFYSVNLPLNLEAISTGLILALIVNFLMQAFLFILVKLFKTYLLDRS